MDVLRRTGGDEPDDNPPNEANDGAGFSMKSGRYVSTVWTRHASSADCLAVLWKDKHGLWRLAIGIRLGGDVMWEDMTIRTDDDEAKVVAGCHSALEGMGKEHGFGRIHKLFVRSTDPDTFERVMRSHDWLRPVK